VIVHLQAFFSNFINRIDTRAPEESRHAGTYTRWINIGSQISQVLQLAPDISRELRQLGLQLLYLLLLCVENLLRESAGVCPTNFARLEVLIVALSLSLGVTADMLSPVAEPVFSVFIVVVADVDLVTKVLDQTVHATA